MRIVFIPGLGYTNRIFENLELSSFTIEYLNWIEPKTNEKINQYALRLFSTIKRSSEKTILIGHSLGGIVSQEIASAHQIEKIILLSSIKSRKELPLYFKLTQPLRLHKLFTRALCLKTVRYWGKGHGFETESEKELFKSMVGKQTNGYLQWALAALSTWHEPKVPSQTEIVQIHGTNDRTLPYRLVSAPDFTIENGTHICVHKKGEMISELIKKIVAQDL